MVHYNEAALVELGCLYMIGPNNYDRRWTGESNNRNKVEVECEECYKTFDGEGEKNQHKCVSEKMKPMSEQGVLLSVIPVSIMCMCMLTLSRLQPQQRGQLRGQFCHLIPPTACGIREEAKRLATKCDCFQDDCPTQSCIPPCSMATTPGL